MIRLTLICAIALGAVHVVKPARVTNIPGAIRISFNNNNNYQNNGSAASYGGYRKLSLGQAMDQTFEDSVVGCRRAMLRSLKRRGSSMGMGMVLKTAQAGDTSPATMRVTCGADCILKRLGLMKEDGTTIPTENFLLGVTVPEERKALLLQLDACLATGDKVDSCKAATTFLGCIMAIENAYALGTIVKVSKAVNFTALMPKLDFDIKKFKLPGGNKISKPKLSTPNMGKFKFNLKPIKLNPIGAPPSLPPLNIVITRKPRYTLPSNIVKRIPRKRTTLRTTPYEDVSIDETTTTIAAVTTTTAAVVHTTASNVTTTTAVVNTTATNVTTTTAVVNTTATNVTTTTAVVNTTGVTTTTAATVTTSVTTVASTLAGGYTTKGGVVMF